MRKRAITLLSTLGEPDELASAYAKTAAYTAVVGYYFANLEKQGRVFSKSDGLLAESKRNLGRNSDA